MAEKKKLAKRVLKRVNGKLTIVYIDVETGQVLTSLDGYTLVSHDGLNTPDSTSEEPKKEEKQPSRDRGSSHDYTDENFFKDSEWAKNRSQGTGDIFKDFKSAGETLKKRMEGAREYLVDGIQNAAGKVVGAIAANDPDTKEAIADGVQTATENVGNAVSGVVDTVGGMFDNLVGGGDVPNTTGNDIVSYSPSIQTRTLPVADKYIETMSAVAQAVNPNIKLVISSGGQPEEGPNRTGSTRHDVDESGVAHTADLMVYINGEQQTTENNPKVFADLVSAAAAVGFTGIGVSDYSHFIHIGGGTPAVWSYGPNGDDIPAKPIFQEAYTKGVQLNKSGAGEKIIQSYVASKGSTQPLQQTAQNVDPVGVTPSLKEFVETFKANKQPTLQQKQPLTPSETELAFNTNPATSVMTEDGTVLNPHITDPNYRPTSLVGGIGSLTPNAPVQQVQVTDNLEEATPPTMQDLIESWPPENVDATNPAVQAINQVAPVQSTGLDPHMKALLDTINYAEGDPLENTLFGYGEFEDLSEHPNEKVYYNNGADFSTAAGYLQINKPTYDDFLNRYPELNPGFDKESQMLMGSYIAKETYAAKYPGRDLIADLSSGNEQLVEQAVSSLSDRWASLPGGPQERTKMKDLMSVYNSTLETYIDQPPKSFRDTSSSVTTNPSYDAAKNAAKQASQATSGFATKMQSKSSSSESNETSYMERKAAQKQAAVKAASKASSSNNNNSSRGSSSSSGTGWPSSMDKRKSKSKSNSNGGGGFASPPTKTKDKSQSTYSSKEKEKSKDKYNGYSYNPSGR